MNLTKINWFFKRFGGFTQNGKKDVAFTMEPIDTGWASFPKGANAVCYRKSYDDEGYVYTRKGMPAVFLFNPETGYSLCLPVFWGMIEDVRDAEALKKVMEEIEPGLPADIQNGGKGTPAE